MRVCPLLDTGFGMNLGKISAKGAEKESDKESPRVSTVLIGCKPRQPQSDQLSESFRRLAVWSESS